MRTITVLLTLFVLLGFVNSPARGDVKVKDFEQYKDQEITKAYINGVGTGFFWANTSLAKDKQKPLYCQPEKLALTEDKFLRILDDTIKELRQKGSDAEDFPVEMILLWGLQKAFPCEK